MSKRNTTIALLVSLAFNLAAIGGFIVMRISRPPLPPPPEQRSRTERRMIGSRTDHSPIPESKEISDLRLKFRQTKEEFMRELAKEEPADEKLNEILNRSLDEQMQLERLLGNSLMQQRAAMSPEEAQEYFARRADRMRERTERIQRWMQNPRRERTRPPTGE